MRIGQNKVSKIFEESTFTNKVRNILKLRQIKLRNQKRNCINLKNIKTINIADLETVTYKCDIDFFPSDVH